MIKSRFFIDDQEKTKLAQPFFVTPHLRKLVDLIDATGGKGIIVGGAVRDHLLGFAGKDLDIEVYGIAAAELQEVLSQHFSVVAVGKAFGIFKVTVTLGTEKQTFDVALPRSENKSGRGHKGFVVNTDPHMSFREAAKRRDFTINAMGIDIDTMELLDPHGGALDLRNRCLKHVSPAFSEDPLRVFRAAQFCARFDLKLDPATIPLCKSLSEELSTLSKERIFEEFKKLVLAKQPSVGLRVLRETDALAMFPELSALIDCPQDPEWHPEGDVWVHSLMVVDQAAKLIRQAKHLDEEEQLVVLLGALCHDLGKPITTIPKDGRIKSPGHEQAGVEPTFKLLTAIGFPKKLHEQVTSLVSDHLKPHQLYRAREEVTDGAIRRLSARVNIEHLLLVSQADFLGRTTADALLGSDPSAAWLKEKIGALLGGELSVKPILMGRHLMELGMVPGVSFSKILRDAFDAQLDGIFHDEESGKRWLKERLKGSDT